MTDFSRNLKRIRKSRNMTQDELAELLGTSKQVISRYENGQRSPKVSVVGEFSRVLGVSIGELTGEDTSPALSPVTLPDAMAPVPDLSEQEAELVGIYRDLNALGQQTLMGTARGLAANPDMKRGGASSAGTA